MTPFTSVLVSAALATSAAPAPTSTPPSRAPEAGSSTPSEAPEGAAEPADAPDTAPSGEAQQEHAAEDGEVTRYTFTGLDIDGELRTPALLQFLARVAGEFETMGIPHRSFMPELEQTMTEDAL